MGNKVVHKDTAFMMRSCLSEYNMVVIKDSIYLSKPIELYTTE